jgi:UDP-2,4-diacetamido-2,4,6-trideoxy-beta-L-altropyranose hydrolase
LLRISWKVDSEQTYAAIDNFGGRTDLLVIDHYSIGREWERALRPTTGRVFVIDDLADRAHDCDILLDQNLHDSPETRYLDLVSESTRLFIGPRYALLRPEFDGIVARSRNSGLRKLLVYFGGTDPTNESMKVLRALREMGDRAPGATFVLGPTNPHSVSIRKAAQGKGGIHIVAATDRIAKLMQDADLGIGTCGGTAWERCVVGLPSLVVVNADNQRDDARILHAMGAVRNLGVAGAVTVEQWIAEIEFLMNDPDSLAKLSLASSAVMRDRKAAVHELEAALVG